MSANFLRQNTKWLIVPALLALASGFGQTFYIAVFGEALRAEFDITHGEWGAIYMLGTLASAICLIRFGGILDILTPRSAAIGLFMGACLALLLFSINPFSWALPLLIFAIRFFGQGMMMNLSQVLLARWFVANRGKAMAYGISGIAVAEASFPLIFVRIIDGFGWRTAFAISAIIAFILGILIVSRLGKARTPQGTAETQEQSGMDGKNWTRQDVAKTWVFWTAMPASICMALLTTVFFFQLPAFAEEKNWALVDFAERLPLFTILAFGFMLLTGALIDRIGSRLYMPFALVPMAIGYALMSIADDLNSATFALVIMGIGQGCAASLLSVWLVDFFGTKHIGAIRALSSGLMIFSTAIGPFLSGIALDLNISYDRQLMYMSAYAFLCTGLYGVVSINTRTRLPR